MQITTKLGDMRRAVEWTVYPVTKDGRMVIQSNKRIAMFHNNGSNKGLLSTAQPSGAYLIHLSPACGAKTVDIPQNIIDEVLRSLYGGIKT